LGLAKGTGCEEIEAAEGTPDRPPAKLRVLEQPSVPTEATTSKSAFSSTTAFKGDLVEDKLTVYYRWPLLRGSILIIVTLDFLASNVQYIHFL